MLDDVFHRNLYKEVLGPKLSCVLNYYDAYEFLFMLHKSSFLVFLSIWSLFCISWNILYTNVINVMILRCCILPYSLYHTYVSVSLRVRPPSFVESWIWKWYSTIVVPFVNKFMRTLASTFHQHPYIFLNYFKKER